MSSSAFETSGGIPKTWLSVRTERAQRGVRSDSLDIKRTWFATGLIFAESRRIWSSGTPKLLTPMLLRDRGQCAATARGVGQGQADFTRPSCFSFSIFAHAVGMSGVARRGW